MTKLIDSALIPRIGVQQENVAAEWVKEAAKGMQHYCAGQLGQSKSTHDSTHNGKINLGKNALDVQEGGDHYKKMPLQPWQYIAANKMNYWEGNVVKYVTRHQSKAGREDLKKARHYLDYLIENYNATYAVAERKETYGQD
jgi:hypothetical protein